MQIMKKTSTLKSQSKTEIALNESEQRYRTTIMSVGDGVIATDTEGRVEMMNPVAEELTGWKEDEARGKPLEEIFCIINEETRKTVENPVRRVISEGIVVGLANHTVLIAKDGTENPIADSGSPIRNEKGEITGVVLVFRDQTKERAAHLLLMDEITERRRMEESLATERSFLRQVIDTVPAFICVKTEAGPYALANKSLAKAYGTIVSDVEGKSDLDFSPTPEEAAAFRKDDLEVIHSQKTKTIAEELITYADGTIHWLSTTKIPILDPDASCSKVLAVAMDITELRNHREHLQELVEKRTTEMTASQTALIEAQAVARMGSWEYDAIGDGIKGSEEFYRLFDVAPKEITRLSQFAGRLHPDDRERVQCDVADALKQNRPYDTDYRVKLGDGGWRNINARGRVFTDTAGKTVSMVGTCLDITERKQAEEALRESQEKYYYLYENSPVGMYHTKIDGSGIIEINNSACKMLGFTKEELIGKPSAIRWADPNRRSEILKILNEHGVAINFDAEILKKDNSKLSCLLSMKVFKDKDYIEGFIIDISDRKLAEEALKDANDNLEYKIKERTKELRLSQQRQFLHVQQTPLAVVEFAVDGTISEWNPAAEIMFGYTMNEAVGKFWTFIVPAKTHPYLDGVWESLVSQKGGTRSSNENVTKDGKIITCEWFNTPLINEEGKTIGVASLIMDISEQKRAEEIIRNSEKDLREYLDVTPFPIAIVDTEDDKINFWSKSALKIFGHIAPTTKEWYDLAYPDPEYQNDVVERWKPILKSAQETGNPMNTGEYNITCHDGSVRICELYIAFLSNRLIVTFNDITERKKSENEIIKHREHLEEMVAERTKDLDKAISDLTRSNQELEQFAYVASHDLQEPLRMVSSYTQLLERRYKDKLDQDATDFINYAVDGANRMQRLINDLLEFSRVTTKGKPLVKMDLSTVLGQAVANLHNKIQETGSMIVNDDLPFAYGDEGQLVRVFQNLLDNAMKFRGEGAPRINVSSKTLEDKVEISISDNGIGIDKIYSERVFTIFQRLHTKADYPGTGIGLAICKRTIERHGGTIWFESEPGKGTTFYFTLNIK
jgi:PAS domain S-box-containing protein